MEVAARFLGSTGCQSATGRIRRGEPVVRGSLPQTGLFLHGVGYVVCANCIWLAAKCYRLAACAPQSGIYTAMGAFIDGCGSRAVKKSCGKPWVCLKRDGYQTADRGSQQPANRSPQFAARACSIQALRPLILVFIRLYLDDVGIGACTTPIGGSYSVIVDRPRT